LGLGYDNLNRLTSATGPWGSGTLSYDGRGNITGQAFGSTSLGYIYDAQNRLSSVSGSRSTSYSYDAVGSVTAGNGAVYTYDAVPALRCVNCSTAAKIEYKYDGLVQRVSTTKANVTTYEFNAFNGDLLVEYTPGSANRLVEYIHLNGKRIAQRVSDNEGIQLIRLPPRSPNLNAFAERFVRSIKYECLNRMIFLGQHSLRHAISQFMAHYHAERNHQGLENRLVRPVPLIGSSQPVRRSQRLGGMLNYYHRIAA